MKCPFQNSFFLTKQRLILPQKENDYCCFDFFVIAQLKRRRNERIHVLI